MNRSLSLSTALCVLLVPLGVVAESRAAHSPAGKTMLPDARIASTSRGYRHLLRRLRRETFLPSRRGRAMPR